jgi:hypothetical protein
MAFTLLFNGDARCGSKPAWRRCNVSFTKEKMRHEILKEPARRAVTLMPYLCLDRPTEEYESIITRMKSARLKNTRKTCGIPNTR